MQHDDIQETIDFLTVIGDMEPRSTPPTPASLSCINPPDWVKGDFTITPSILHSQDTKRITWMEDMALSGIKLLNDRNMEESTTTRLRLHTKLNAVKLQALTTTTPIRIDDSIATIIRKPPESIPQDTTSHKEVIADTIDMLQYAYSTQPIEIIDKNSDIIEESLIDMIQVGRKQHEHTDNELLETMRLMAWLFLPSTARGELIISMLENNMVIGPEPDARP